MPHQVVQLLKQLLYQVQNFPLSFSILLDCFKAQFLAILCCLSGVCKHFQRGQCFFGDSCRFIHGIFFFTLISYDTTFIQFTRSYSWNRCYLYLRFICRTVLIARARKPAICKRFNLGSCTYGDSCKFKHAIPRKGKNPLPQEPVFDMDGNECCRSYYYRFP